MKPELSRQCVILVGGLGSRLGGLTQTCPKPLLEVGGRPFLAQLIDNARRFGFDDFLLLAGYRGAMLSAFAESQPGTRVIIEPEPAGTAGALFHARDFLADEFLMLNGDSLFDFNWLDMAIRPVIGDWKARIALRQVADTARYGAIELAGDYVRSFREKTLTGAPGLINGGVYWLRRAILTRIDGQPASLERDVFPILARRRELRGFPYEGPFVDIGIPDDLTLARGRWREFRQRPAVFFDRDGVLNHDDGYTYRIEDFRWIDGAMEAIKHCNDTGRYVFVVTNQSGIARGLYEEAHVSRLHDWMNNDLRTGGAHIDDFRYCPHHVDGIIAKYAKACSCRKPRPGMILSLLADWPVETSQSLLIGNEKSDIDAAVAAGVRGILYDASQPLVLP